MQHFASPVLLILSGMAVMYLQAEAVVWNFQGIFTPQRRVPGLCLNCQCGRASARRFKRLVGGNNVTDNSYPWLAAIYLSNNETRTGALISRMHVLTSASAVDGIPATGITVGLDQGNKCVSSVTGLNVSATQVSIQPGVDLAVITLGTRLTFTNRIRPICLPPYTTSNYQRQVATVGSWGLDSNADNATQPCTAKAVYLPILPLQSCSSAGVNIGTGMGCIGTVGTESPICPSDAGGLVQVFTGQFYQLIGILPNSNECDGALGPSTFIRTAPNLEWILQITSDSCYCTAY